MSRALKLLFSAKPIAPTLVEIGTLRDPTIGGGHSTFKFGEYCSCVGGTLHSVDISAEAIRFSRRAVADFIPWVRHHVSDSTEFLSAFDGTIDLLYLDGFDATSGNERAASEKQLSEIVAALPHLAQRCLVLLDDADLPHRGKVRLSAPYLIESGFTPLASGYQLLFGRGFGAARPYQNPCRSWITKIFSRRCYCGIPSSRERRRDANRQKPRPASCGSCGPREGLS